MKINDIINENTNIDLMTKLKNLAGFHHVEQAVDEFRRGLSYEQKANGLNPNASKTRKIVFNNIAKKWNYYSRLLDK
jgi:hypothetical protein